MEQKDAPLLDLSIEKVYFLYMDFEWDSAKSKTNLDKHGISFLESLEIWQGIHLEVHQIARSKEGESRSATIGMVKGELYTAIWTQRGKKLRLISVRRSRHGEKKIFWHKTVSFHKGDG